MYQERYQPSIGGSCTLHAYTTADSNKWNLHHCAIYAGLLYCGYLLHQKAREHDVPELQKMGWSLKSVLYLLMIYFWLGPSVTGLHTQTF
jgi:hypothetical protein